MTIPTPVLDKARSEELTSYELRVALRELEALNGAGSRAALVIGGFGYFGRDCCILWDGRTEGKRGEYPEDALVAEADELRRLIEEERAS